MLKSEAVYRQRNWMLYELYDLVAGFDRRRTVIPVHLNSLQVQQACQSEASMVVNFQSYLNLIEYQYPFRKGNPFTSCLLFQNHC